MYQGLCFKSIIYLDSCKTSVRSVILHTIRILKRNRYSEELSKFPHVVQLLGRKGSLNKVG